MPTVPGEVVSPSSSVVSPSELLKDFIEQYADKEVIPGGVVVGGADDEQQQKGCVALMDAGNTENETGDAPLLWKRCQVRGVAGSLAQADEIGNYMFELLKNQKWLELEDSNGTKWFVHLITMTAGPSHHLDSEETFESLSFANITVGSEPIPK